MTTLDEEEEVKDELLVPPSWDEVEADSEFQALSPMKRQVVLSNWTKAVNDYAKSTGEYQADPEAGRAVVNFARQKTDEYSKSLDLAVEGGIYEDNLWGSVKRIGDRAVLGAQQIAPNAISMANRAAELVVQSPELMTSALDAVGVNRLSPINSVREKGITQSYRDLSEPLRQSFRQTADYYRNESNEISQAGAALGGGIVGELTQAGITAAGEAVQDMTLAMGSGGASVPQTLARPMAAAMRSLNVSSVLSAVRSALPTLDAAEAQYMQEDPTLTREQARLKALPEAMTSGASTALVTRLGGFTGIESVLLQGGPKTLRGKVVEVLKEAMSEGIEEAADQSLQDLSERFYRNPEKAWADTYKELAMAFTLGSVLGGGFSAVGQAMNSAADKAAANSSPQTAAVLRERVAKEASIKTAKLFGDEAAVNEASALESEILDDLEGDDADTAEENASKSLDGVLKTDGQTITKVADDTGTAAEPDPNADLISDFGIKKTTPTTDATGVIPSEQPDTKPAEQPDAAPAAAADTAAAPTPTPAPAEPAAPAAQTQAPLTMRNLQGDVEAPENLQAGAMTAEAPAETPNLPVQEPPQPMPTGRAFKPATATVGGREFGYEFMETVNDEETGDFELASLSFDNTPTAIETLKDALKERGFSNVRATQLKNGELRLSWNAGKESSRVTFQPAVKTADQRRVLTSKDASVEGLNRILQSAPSDKPGSAPSPVTAAPAPEAATLAPEPTPISPPQEGGEPTNEEEMQRRTETLNEQPPTISGAEGQGDGATPPPAETPAPASPQQGVRAAGAKGVISGNPLPVVEQETGRDEEGRPITKIVPAFVNDADTLAESLHQNGGAERIYIPDEILDSEDPNDAIDNDRIGYNFEKETGRAYVTWARHSRYPDSPVMANGRTEDNATLEQLYQADPKRQARSEAQTKGEGIQLIELSDQFMQDLDNAPMSDVELDNPETVNRELNRIESLAQKLASETVTTNDGKVATIGANLATRIGIAAKNRYLARLRGLVSGKFADANAVVAEVKAKAVRGLQSRGGENVGVSMDQQIGDGDATVGDVTADQNAATPGQDGPIVTQAEDDAAELQRTQEQGTEDADQAPEPTETMQYALDMAVMDLPPQDRAIWLEYQKRSTTKREGGRAWNITKDQKRVSEAVAAKARENLVELLAQEQDGNPDDEGSLKPASNLTEQEQAQADAVKKLEDAALEKKVRDNTRKVLDLANQQPGEKVSIRNILESLSKDKKETALVRFFANWLLKSGHNFSEVRVLLIANRDKRTNWAGLYKAGRRASSGTISINTAADHRGSIGQTVLHEALHHIVLYKLRPSYKRNAVEKAAYRDLMKVLTYARRQLLMPEAGETLSQVARREFGGDDTFYGLTNIDEMFTETLTNERFFAWLNSQKPIAGIQSKGFFQNLWQQVRSLFQNLIYGSEVRQSSLLSQALDNIMALGQDAQSNAKITEYNRTAAERSRRRAESVTKPYEALRGRSLENAMENTVPESAQSEFLGPDDYAKAVQVLSVLVNDPASKAVRARGGRTVNLNNPDYSTARFLKWDPSRALEARVEHALTESADRATPNADKIATAPMIPQTLRQADFVARREFAGKPLLVYAKLYTDPNSPTGVRWHFVEVWENTGDFETQYSSTNPTKGRALGAVVIGIGDSTPKKNKAPTEAGYAQGPSGNTPSNPQGIEPDVSSGRMRDGGAGREQGLPKAEPQKYQDTLPDVSPTARENIDSTTDEGVQQKVLEEIVALEEKRDRLIQNNQFEEAGRVDAQINALNEKFFPGNPPSAASAPASGAQKPSREVTSSLSRALLGANPEARRILSKSTYISTSNSVDDAAAQSWLIGLIGQSGATLEDAELSLAQIRNDRFPALTPQQQTLAKAHIALRYGDMSRFLADDISKSRNFSQQPLLDSYRDAHVRLLNELQEQGSIAGQDLQIFAKIANIFQPVFAARSYTAPFTKTQTTELDKGGVATTVKDALSKSVEDGVTATLGKTQILRDKINAVGMKRGNVPPTVGNMVQDIFDFFFQVDRNLGGSGFPVTEDLAQNIAEGIVKRMTKTPASATPQPFLSKLRKDAAARVASELAPLLRVKGAGQTQEQAIREGLAQMQKDLDIAPLVSTAFERARGALLNDPNVTLEPEVRRSLEAYQFDPVALRGAQKVVRAGLNIQDLITRTIKERTATVEDFIGKLVADYNLPEPTAKLVANAVRSRFTEEARRAAANRLSSLVREKKAPAKLSKSDKLLKLINIGGFSEEQFYNALAKQFDLPSYDDATVAKLEAEAERIQGLPKGSDVRNEATIKLMGDIAEGARKSLVGFPKWKFILGDLAPAVWQASILSGPPTHLVNYFSTLANIGLQSVSDASGFAWASFRKGASVSDVARYYSDIFSAFGTTYLQKDSVAKLESLRSLSTGVSRYKNAKLEDVSLFERMASSDKTVDRIISNYKWIGRVMLATDALNSGTAQEIRMRHAMRYAATLEGKRGAELEAAILDVFEPEQQVLADIDKQVEQEDAQGVFRGARDPNLAKRIRREELIEARRGEAVIESGQEAAGKWTFNGDPKGMAGFIFDGLINGMNKKLKVTKFLFPFMRTMGNLLDTSLDFTPGVGQLRAYNVRTSRMLGADSKYAVQIERGSPEFYSQQAKAWAGTIAFAAVLQMALKGLEDEEEGKDSFFAVYGAGPEDKFQRQQLQAAGWQPNSIKIMGKYFRYTDWPGVNIGLAAIGSLSDYARNNRDSDTPLLKKIGLAILGTASAITEKSMLGGMTNIITILANPDSRGLNAATRQLASPVSGVTNPPLFSWLRSTLFAGEDGKNEVLDRSGFDGIMHSIVPFSIGAKTSLNVLGEPIQEYWHAATTRRFGYFDSVVEHPIITPLAKAGLFVPSPSKSTTVLVPDREKPMTLSRAGDDAWRKFLVYRGEELKRRLTTESVARYTSLDREVAQTVLDGPDIKGAATDFARAMVERDIREGKIKIQDF